MAWSTTAKVALFVGVLAGVGLAGGLLARAAGRKGLVGAEDERVAEGEFEWDDSWVEWETYLLADGSFRVDYSSDTGEGSMCCYGSAEEAVDALFVRLGAPVDASGGELP